MVVVDIFSKMPHFIPCYGIDDVIYIAELYFKEIIRLYRVPKNLLFFHEDSRFLSHFCRSLWKLLGTKLLFSTTYHPQTDGQTKAANQTLTTFA